MNAYIRRLLFSLSLILCHGFDLGSVRSVRPSASGTLITICLLSPRRAQREGRVRLEQLLIRVAERKRSRRQDLVHPALTPSRLA